MEDDWDLQAVVRGCTSTTTVTATATATATTSASGVLRGYFPPLSMEEETESLLCFSDLFDRRNSFGELEELYKPFFPKMPQPLSPQWIPTSSLPNIGGLKDQPQQQQQQQQRQTRQQPQPQRSPAASKRRKNQQKKVVRQVAAEGLSSDVWAWRKYGQKPIKGSPYPRGYYRCSSSKGCLARKQVERSRTDPAMFIITYTAEHNHPVPTHRNSLAGSTRQKVSTPQQAMTSDDPDTPTCKPSCSPISTTGLSPTTPLMASIEDEHVQQTKQDSKQDEEGAVIEENEEDLVIPDMEMTDDFFMGLDSLSEPIMTSAASPAFDDCFSDSFSDHLSSTFPPPWFANNPTTAGGGV